MKDPAVMLYFKIRLDVDIKNERLCHRMLNSRTIDERQYPPNVIMQLRDKFPAHFKDLPCVCPHEESFPQHIVVYRLCVNDEKLNEDDFIPTYKEITTRPLKTDDPSTYSVSFFADINDINKIKTFRKNTHKHAIQGAIKKKYGFARNNPSSAFKSHYDLWLYEYAEPWIDYLKTDEGDSDE